MVARWQFDSNCLDQTENLLDAVAVGSVTYETDMRTSGNSAILLSGQQYLQLPYGIASSDELTVSFWVRWNNNALAGQYLFDFGNAPDRHFYLAANVGNSMRFGMRNGDDEQVVNVSRLTRNVWQHVAVSIGRDKTTVYVDGQEVGSSTGLTIRPSDICPVLNYVGRSIATGGNSLRANIDDMRLFNYALDGDAVRQVMDDTYTSVEAVRQPDAPSPAAFYSVDGKRYDQPRQGLNIIKYTDGSTSKAIRK